MEIKIHFKNGEERHFKVSNSLDISDENKTQIIKLEDKTTVRFRNRDILYTVEDVSEI